MKTVDAFQLFPDEHNVRQSIGIPDELVDSIRQQGIIEPLIVREKDGKLLVVAGSRRMQAAQALGLKQVPVKVIKADDFEAAGISYQENEQRQDLSAIEKADALREMWDLLPGKSEEKYRAFEEKIGIKKEVIKKYLSVSNLPDLAKELGNKLPNQDVLTLSEVSREQGWGDEAKAEAIEVLSEVPTTTERRELVKELREKAEEGLSPREAFEQIQAAKQEEAPDVEKWRYAFRIRRSVKSRFLAKCKESGKEPDAVVVELIEGWVA